MPTLMETYLATAHEIDVNDPDVVAQMNNHDVQTDMNNLGLDNDEVLAFLRESDMIKSVLFSVTEGDPVQTAVLLCFKLEYPAIHRIMMMAILAAAKNGIIIGAAHARALAAELHDDVLGDS